jgi:hypothetical protein
VTELNTGGYIYSIYYTYYYVYYFIDNHNDDTQCHSMRTSSRTRSFRVEALGRIREDHVRVWVSRLGVLPVLGIATGLYWTGMD